MNEDGTTYSETVYDEFGKVETESSPDTPRFGFTGHQRGPQSDPDLYYAQQRYYNAATGRFISEDPLLGMPDKPLSLHRYLYAYANPTVYVDPDGRAAVVREEEIAALYQMSEAGRGVVVRSSSMRALVKEHELEDQISIRGPGRSQYLMPEGVRALHAAIQAASQSGGAPRAILLVESDDEPESIRKMFEEQVGDYGGVFALLQAEEFDQEHEPGSVFDITAALETAEQNYRASLLLAPLVENVRERRSQLATGAQKATFLSQLAYDTLLESNLTMRYLVDQVPGGRRAPAGIGQQLREDAVFAVAAAAVPVARFGKSTSQATLRSKCAQNLAFCGMSLLPQEPTDKNFLERFVPNPSDDHIRNIRSLEDFKRNLDIEGRLRSLEKHLPRN